MIVATLNSCYIARAFGTRQEETCNIHRDKVRNVFLGQTNHDHIFCIKEFEVCLDSHRKPLKKKQRHKHIFIFEKNHPGCL